MLYMATTTRWSESNRESLHQTQCASNNGVGESLEGVTNLCSQVRELDGVVHGLSHVVRHGGLLEQGCKATVRVLFIWVFCHWVLSSSSWVTIRMIAGSSSRRPR